MKINSTNWFFEKLKSDNQCLLYNGNFTDDITVKIVDLTKFNLENQEEKLKIKKRVSYLMTECFQNIIRHGGKAEKEKTLTQDPGFFMTRNSSGKYYITSGNLIDKKKVAKLKGQLDQVNKLNKDELKEIYKKIVKEGQLSDKGGAGLGFIDMARKSDQILGYSFNNYDDVFPVFYNQIVLNSETESQMEEEGDFDIEFAIDLHDKMKIEDILMLQKGDFSRDSILPVLKIIENNIMHEYQDSSLMKEVYHVLVELLQNISRHGYSENEFKEGIFVLFKKGEKYGISTGNYIENSKIKAFEDQLIKINSLNKDELRNLYLHQLKHGEETEKGGAGIGLIDTARLLTEKLEYSFIEHDNNRSFFTINVII